eukprot:3684092-Pyramimonas_sp.AAC.1
MLDTRLAMSYSVEHDKVRDQLDDARKARGFFKPKGSSKRGNFDKDKDMCMGKGESGQGLRIWTDEWKLPKRRAKCKQ